MFEVDCSLVELMQALAKSHARLKEVDEALKELSAHREEVVQETQVLQAIAEREGLLTDGGGLLLMGRSEAVEHILQAADSPLSPTEVHQHLLQAGRTEDSIEDVNGTLSYLKRKGTAYAIGRGRWILGNPEEPF